jgi:hypothetical protein
VASPVTAEKLSLTSGKDRQYVDDLHNNSMHLQSQSNTCSNSNEGLEKRVRELFGVEEGVDEVKRKGDKNK